MKFGAALFATVVLGSGADAFTSSVKRSSRVAPLNIAEELGTPCEDECALKSYPNMPESVHPGVVTGQAMIDLLNHAKENGELIVLRKRNEQWTCRETADAAACVIVERRGWVDRRFSVTCRAFDIIRYSCHVFNKLRSFYCFKAGKISPTKSCFLCSFIPCRLRHPCCQLRLVVRN